MRTYIKRVRKALAAEDLNAARTSLPLAIQAIDKARSKGVIHINTASRYISRLTVAMNQAASA